MMTYCANINANNDQNKSHTRTSGRERREGVQRPTLSQKMTFPVSKDAPPSLPRSPRPCNAPTAH